MDTDASNIGEDGAAVFTRLARIVADPVLLDDGEDGAAVVRRLVRVVGDTALLDLTLRSSVDGGEVKVSSAIIASLSPTIRSQ